jgi:hypothetical protein
MFVCVCVCVSECGCACVRFSYKSHMQERMLWHICNRGMWHTGYLFGNVGFRSRLDDMCRRENNFKMNRQRIHLDMDSIHVAEDRGKGRFCLNTIMYFVFITRGQFFD